MTNLDKGLVAVVVVLVAFAAGRYTSPQVASKDVLKNTIMDSTKDKAQDTHTVTTVTTTVDAKTGAKVTTTVTDTKQDTHTVTDVKKTTDTKTNVTYTTRPRNNVSALAGIDFSSKKPVYGASVTRELLGPITVGVWGLSNMSGGVSLGVNF